ncbi:unnamed protein product [Caenorhabditis bovis]|uniref:Zinc metalloproteinase n=1 Tax=Caenorhabditis bovis TaxID=2654633 RepID=A0A8S1EXM6_9PELO|nr:unnamed protein product [Caenorhabditis bovis]
MMFQIDPNAIIAVTLLYFRLVAADSQNLSAKLYDLVKPSDTHRLFDTLQYAVEEQYSRTPVFYDFSTMFNYGEKPINLERLNRKYHDVLYEGDMAFGYEQLSRIVNSAVEFRRPIRNKIRDRRQAYLDANYPATIWEHGVPFVLHSSLNALARSSILNAIHFWYRETCIEFVPRTRQSDYLVFVGDDEGCWSTVGKDGANGKQVVSIGEGCEHFGVTSHELAHALGLFHEQSRYDRDESVTLNPRVVDRSLLFNFAKISRRQLSTYDLPYDIGSVMHYTPTEFSTVPSIPTLMAVDANLQQTMGQLDGPSFIDVLIMNRHYNCQAKCEKQAACENGGFTNSRNCAICKCPSGFGGRHCEQIAPSFSTSCGGVLNADETARQFDITIRQNGGRRAKTCVYHLKAPKGKKIVVEIRKIDSKCIEGCWLDGLELKMRADVRPTGYRFCCPESSKRKVVSDGNLVPMIVYSKDDTISASLQYFYVDASVSFDESPTKNLNAILGVTHSVADGISTRLSRP